jgi:broad-specificity NMP kinase
MNITTNSQNKLLTRTVNPTEIPAIDRAIGLATAELVIALDRSFVDEIFFSRSVAACNGAWVWADPVLREMSHAKSMRRDPDTLLEGVSRKSRKPSIERIPLPGHRESGTQSIALVSPDRILETSSATFADLSFSVQRRLQVAKDTVAWLSQAQDPSVELPFMRNARYLGQSLGMSDPESRVLELMALAMASDPFKSALCAISLNSMGTAANLIAKWIGADRPAIHSLFSANGVLVQGGIHDGLLRHIGDMEDALRLDNYSLAAHIQEPQTSLDEFLNSFLNLAAPSQITADSVPHMTDFHAMAKSLLVHAAAQDTVGVNVMLYGAPGTGKTEYAKLMAKEAGLTLYEVPYVDNTGCSLEPQQRLGSLMMMLNALRNRTDAALLFDEAEDIFDTPSDKAQKSSKAWMNHFIETMPVPVIWTSNSLRNVDPAHLRRFAILKEFAVAPRSVKDSFIRKYLEKLQLPEQDIQAIASLTHLVPGHVENAARTVMLAKPTTDEQAAQWVQQHIDTSRRALGLSALNTRQANTGEYDPVFVNTSDGPSTLRLVAYLQKSPRLSLCLHGTPGTGKTGFAKFLADQLGRELIVKTASSLLSKYIGETEQRICAMFEEASLASKDTVLLLDEADTLLRNRENARHSWEVSHTNEFLARMEAFTGTFICTTNLMEELDPAILRRFQFKLRFNTLKTEQAEAMFVKVFATPAPENLKNVSSLVPADFINVRRQLVVYGDEIDPKEYVNLLDAEVRGRRGDKHRSNPIGFMSKVGA